jgi:hypothetical protein
MGANLWNPQKRGLLEMPIDERQWFTSTNRQTVIQGIGSRNLCRERTWCLPADSITGVYEPEISLKLKRFCIGAGFTAITFARGRFPLPSWAGPNGRHSITPPTVPRCVSSLGPPAAFRCFVDSVGAVLILQLSQDLLNVFCLILCLSTKQRSWALPID